MPRAHPFAHICSACQHPASRHGLVSGGTLRAGPYRCPCSCEIAQDAPMFTVSRDEFERMGLEVAA